MISLQKQVVGCLKPVNLQLYAELFQQDALLFSHYIMVCNRKILLL